MTNHVTLAVYIAPAGLEEYGIHEGDRLLHNHGAEAVYCSFVVPIGLLGQCGRPVALIKGHIMVPVESVSDGA